MRDYYSAFVRIPLFRRKMRILVGTYDVCKIIEPELKDDCSALTLLGENLITVWFNVYDDRNMLRSDILHEADHVATWLLKADKVYWSAQHDEIHALTLVEVTDILERHVYRWWLKKYGTKDDLLLYNLQRRL